MSTSHHSPAQFVTPAERREALRVAASVLKARWPSRQAAILIEIGPNTLAAFAAFDYPGVVRVTMRHTGELIAQSKPGHPSELDPCVS